MKDVKCPHGYHDDLPSNRCPWCHGFDATNHDAVPVVGHGNGWLLRRGILPCDICGGPGGAGWGGYDGPHPPPQAPRCYPCAFGYNTPEALAKKAAHEARRGRKKIRGTK